MSNKLTDDEKYGAVYQACRSAVVSTSGVDVHLPPAQVLLTALVYTVLDELVLFFDGELDREERGEPLHGENGLRQALVYRLDSALDIPSMKSGKVYVMNFHEVADEMVRSIKRVTEQAVQRAERARQ